MGSQVVGVGETVSVVQGVVQSCWRSPGQCGETLHGALHVLKFPVQGADPPPLGWLGVEAEGGVAVAGVKVCY